MSNVVGNKMSDCTPLDPSEKEYFFGEGEGAVVTVGEVNASSGTVNRLVQLTDIAGDELPQIGNNDANKVLTVNSNSDGVEWQAAQHHTYYADAPIVTAGYHHFGLSYNSNQFESVGSPEELCLKNPVPTPGANHADAGKVLTVKTINNTDEIVWDSPASPQVTIDGTTIMDGADGLHVNPGYGLTVGSGALCANIRAKYGLESDENGIQVVVDKGIMITSSGGVGIDFKNAAEGKVLTAHETEDTDDDGNAIYDIAWSEVTSVPSTTGASDGNVLTYNATNDEIVWAASNGVPSTASLDNSKTYKLQCDKGTLKWVEDKSGS